MVSQDLKLAAIQHFKRESKVTELSLSKFACIYLNSQRMVKNAEFKSVKLRQVKDLSFFCFGGPASNI